VAVSEKVGGSSREDLQVLGAVRKVL
jgi:hypothetical protein